MIMGFVQQEGLKYYQFDLFNDRPFYHAILTRQGGVSQPPFDTLNTGGTVGDNPQDVLKNHHLIYDTLGFDFQSRFDVWQVHGTKILCTDAPRPQDTPHPKADGILTDKAGVTLFMRFADCVPILLYDPVKKVIGIVHAGWQGTVKKIAKAAVEKLMDCYGSNPETLLVGIGPSICQSCYEVGDEVHQAFLRSFDKKAEQYFNKENDRYYLDLWGANLDVLKAAGVQQIEVAAICTACHLEDWYSHRAENGKTGRFAVLMALG
jgi:YfiH family protein